MCLQVLLDFVISVEEQKEINSENIYSKSWKLCLLSIFTDLCIFFL